ncbi:alpha/beta fold hydrolase [Betaproteobacteria bacterium LSUCC0115]|nr:alpha/beta fold hydrolase [Burkholderiales bacterium LSUCC0115]
MSLNELRESLIQLPSGAELTTFQIGEGPDLVYLPGSNVDFRLRRAVFSSVLVKAFRVTTFEYRGLARSKGPDGHWRMVDFSDDVVGVMDALGLHRADLIGESFGAMVAQWAVLANPDRFNRVALACGSAGGAAGQSFPFHEWLDKSAEERARQVLLHINVGNQDIAANDPQRFDQMVAGRVQFEQAFLAGLAQADGYRRLLQARAEHDCAERLNTLTHQTWVMGGREDGIAPVPNQERLAALMPVAKLRLFSGGHDFLWAGPEPIGFLIKEWG